MPVSDKWNLVRRLFSAYNYLDDVYENLTDDEAEKLEELIEKLEEFKGE